MIKRYTQILVVDSQANLPTGALVGDLAYSTDTQVLGVYNGTAWVFPLSPIISKTSNYTVTPIDYTVQCDATSGNITITLPTAVGICGKVYVIKKVDSSPNTVIIDAAGSETIQAFGQPALTQVLTSQGDTLSIQSNNLNWIGY